MKKAAAGLAVVVLAAGLLVAAPKSETFSGEIMDSQCATMGSHDEMMKKEGASSPKECTLQCVKMGSKYVLLNSSSHKVYQLSDQSAPEQYAGQKVKVTGSLDKASNTVQVQKISPAT
jgi:hypothetical protein